jgi:hypothetical protein
MGGHLLMSEGERLRKVILEGVRDGRVALKTAALRLGMTYRQLRRIWKRFRDEGDPGLIHRGRGRPSNRSKPASLRDRAIRRYRERYEGFGPTLACEKLAEEGVILDHETLRRWLIEERLWAGPKARTRHRAYRERKARFGEMLQLDGSQHRWFGRHEPEACLMNMVDDATGTTLSLMTESETLEGAMRLLWRWIERYGVPVALYTDRLGIRMGLDSFPKTFLSSGRTGFYMKVLEEGEVGAGDRFERVAGEADGLSVREVWRLAVQDVRNLEGARKALRLSSLAPEWRGRLEKRFKDAGISIE